MPPNTPKPPLLLLLLAVTLPVMLPAALAVEAVERMLDDDSMAPALLLLCRWASSSSLG